MTALHSLLVAERPNSRLLDVAGTSTARNRIPKRCVDTICGAGLLVALTPVLLFAALCSLIANGWPIFYISQRFIGVDRAIRVLKFRTMVKEATSPKYRLNERFMRNGFLDIPITCEVYTPLGRLLERLQIVEVPQLINVLLHGMSLVGNRPLPKANVELLTRFPGWERRFSSPAGITGIAQVVGKLNLEPRERLRLESLYSKVYQQGNIVKCDLTIMWLTLARVLMRNKGISLDQAEALLQGCLPDRQMK